MSLEQLIKREFQLDHELIYLNHAAIAPWPTRTKLAVERFATESAVQGSKHYLQWVRHETELRSMLATLINAPSGDDIALLKNTSEGLSVVAHGLDWQPGDNVVISDQEFPSNRIVWESLQRYGVTVRQVDLSSAATPELALIAACDAKTRVLAVSSVQFASGLKMDLRVLGDHCRRHHILFCVDAIQSIGAHQVDVQACQADFMMADGHKWMLAPEGLALFYCRADLREQLTLHQYGWHMVDHPHDFTRTEWLPAANGQRFECGSPNMLHAHALHASISLLLEVGMATVEARILDNSDALFALLQQHEQLEILSDMTGGRYAGIVTFRHRHVASDQLYTWLMEHGVMCAPRGGGIRFSPHFYTATALLEKAINLVVSCPAS
ncbi:MAG: aminotransferase class V-fold PLP-dependent enzyme [Gammaproteobacteria bacterium]|nr:aminotransferase class V-fold PLP-dependent enzyme [Gammaproteobacteria bacterium]MDH5652697.1 aminotransferase class V-fold PLP-dependent enzyme [Gammaproteobacteria bacterium]